MQLLDYITSSTYGKGLDIENDISLSDWLAAARTCDSRGTQTYKRSSSSSVAAGKRYVLTDDGTDGGNIIAMGLVKEASTGTNDIIFEEMYGGMGVPLPGLTKLIISASNFVQSMAGLISFITLGAIYYLFGLANKKLPSPKVNVDKNIYTLLQSGSELELRTDFVK